MRARTFCGVSIVLLFSAGKYSVHGRASITDRDWGFGERSPLSAGTWPFRFCHFVMGGHRDRGKKRFEKGVGWVIAKEFGRSVDEVVLLYVGSFRNRWREQEALGERQKHQRRQTAFDQKITPAVAPRSGL